MQENKFVEISLQVKKGRKMQHIYVRTSGLAPSITTLLNSCAKLKTSWHLDLCYLSAL